MKEMFDCCIKLHSCPTLVSWLLPTKSCCSPEQSRLEAVSHSLSPLYWHDSVLCQTQRQRAIPNTMTMCYTKPKAALYWHDKVLYQTWSSSVLTWYCAIPNTMTVCYTKWKAVLYWHDNVLYQTRSSSVLTWQCATPNTKLLCTDMTMCFTKHKAALYWHDNVLYQTQSSVS